MVKNLLQRFGKSGGGDPAPEPEVVAENHSEDRTCPSCGASLQPGQEYCLDCGSSLWQRRSTWRVPAAIVGATLAFAGTSTAVAFVAMADDGPKAVTSAENAPPETRTAPAPASAPPATTSTSPPPVSTPPGGDSGSPPPVSTPKPSATKPPKAVTIPPTSSGSSGFSGSSGGSSGSSGGSGGSSGGSGGSGGSSGGSGGSSGGSGGSSGGSGGGGTETTPKPASTEITLDGDPVETYDPFGNGPENDTAVEDAIDGDGANTYWETEQYPGGDLGKDGVGLVL